MDCAEMKVTQVPCFAELLLPADNDKTLMLEALHIFVEAFL